MLGVGLGLGLWGSVVEVVNYVCDIRDFLLAAALGIELLGICGLLV